MKTWNYKMYCLHEELTRKAIAYIINDQKSGWQILYTAILVESIVAENVSRLLRRRRLEMLGPSRQDKMKAFVSRLAADLNTVNEILKELDAEMALCGNPVRDDEELLQGAM
ncbi:MAG: hypothetical protein HKN43_01360 [Rhodothermales bacterium]|nr:hypothetical protein [Rhodothermales bacterium]